MTMVMTSMPGVTRTDDRTAATSCAPAAGRARAVTSCTTNIRVLCGDPLIRDGVASQLSSRIGVRIVDVGDGDDQPIADAVAVVVADEVDTPTILRIREARARGHVKVVLLAARLDEESVLAAVEAGVGSILWRHEATVEAIVVAARATSDGHGLLPPDLLGRLLDRVGSMHRRTPARHGPTRTGLSPREADVLRLVADGYDTSEIGERLAYSERTVKAIIHDVTNRLDLRNRTHAVAYALRHGLI